MSSKRFFISFSLCLTLVVVLLATSRAMPLQAEYALNATIVGIDCEKFMDLQDDLSRTEDGGQVTVECTPDQITMNGEVIARAGDTINYVFNPSNGVSGCDNYAQTRLELDNRVSTKLWTRVEKCSGVFNGDGTYKLSVDGIVIDDWSDNYNAGDSRETMLVDFLERFGNPDVEYELQGRVGGNSELETGSVMLQINYIPLTSAPPFSNYKYEVSTTEPQCTEGPRYDGALELRPSGSQLEVRVTKCAIEGGKFKRGGVAVLWIDGIPYGIYKTYSQGDSVISFLIDPASEGFSDTDWHTYSVRLGENAELVTGVVSARIIEATTETVFTGNPSSHLYFDQNGARINLKVCADNLNGQTVRAQLSRLGQTYAVVSEHASGRCVTFWNMDGSGNVDPNTPYTTRVALNQNPSVSWPVPCYYATSGKGLCDTKTYSAPSGNSSIVQSAKNLIGMPYPPRINDPRQVFCGQYGPWKSRYGVCTDLAIDAYLWGTGGSATTYSCGTSQWTAMRNSSGGINIEKLLYDDHVHNPGRYRWGSARNSQDMRIYFRYNQQYLSCDSSNWRAGDVVWFDWGGDGKADHTGVITAIDGNGDPTKMTHTPGCRGSKCSCPNKTACETSWNNAYQHSCVAHGRLNDTLSVLGLQDINEANSFISFEVQTSDADDVEILIYTPDGRLAEKSIDYDYVVQSNEDFIPYAPYQYYENDDISQKITLYDSMNGIYWIQIKSISTTSYSVEVQYSQDVEVTDRENFSGNLVAGELLNLGISLANDSGELSVVTAPYVGGLLEVPDRIHMNDSFELNLAEISGVRPVNSLTLKMTDLQTNEGKILPSSSLVVSENDFDVLAGMSKSIRLEIGQAGLNGHIYRGSLIVEGEGVNIRVPIEYAPSEKVYLPMINR